MHACMYVCMPCIKSTKRSTQWSPCMYVCVCIYIYAYAHTQVKFYTATLSSPGFALHQTKQLHMYMKHMYKIHVYINTYTYAHAQVKFYTVTLSSPGFALHHIHKMPSTASAHCIQMHAQTFIKTRINAYATGQVPFYTVTLSSPGFALHKTCTICMCT
jgi:hypothetical protein